MFLIVLLISVVSSEKKSHVCLACFVLGVWLQDVRSMKCVRSFPKLSGYISGTDARWYISLTAYSQKLSLP